MAYRFELVAREGTGAWEGEDAAIWEDFYNAAGGALGEELEQEQIAGDDGGLTVGRARVPHAYDDFLQAMVTEGDLSDALHRLLWDARPEPTFRDAFPLRSEPINPRVFAALVEVGADLELEYTAEECRDDYVLVEVDADPLDAGRFAHRLEALLADAGAKISTTLTNEIEITRHDPAHLHGLFFGALAEAREQYGARPELVGTGAAEALEAYRARAEALLAPLVDPAARVDPADVRAWGAELTEGLEALRRRFPNAPYVGVLPSEFAWMEAFRVHALNRARSR
ncbi:MAG: hypothetical protein Q8P41_13980 [Pseudomonadota bacterium]|nr:hypothetical protein [Pseudomonadota bacterium]